MANFLRDQMITNLKLTEDKLIQINQKFIERLNSFNSKINDDNKMAQASYIIRFDGKGYKLYSFDELLPYFHQAKELERIIFTLETPDSRISNRINGTSMELKLDTQNAQNCILVVTSDDHDWVDASFAAVRDLLSKYQSKMKACVRTPWTQLIIQVFGVVIGFSLSLWGAIKTSPMLSINDSVAICFFFFILIFSNMWSYLNKSILTMIDKYFPNVQLYRPDKDKINWLMQALIGGTLTALVLAIIHFGYTHMISMINSLLNGSMS